MKRTVRTVSALLAACLLPALPAVAQQRSPLQGEVRDVEAGTPSLKQQVAANDLVFKASNPVSPQRTMNLFMRLYCADGFPVQPQTGELSDSSALQTQWYQWLSSLAQSMKPALLDPSSRYDYVDFSAIVFRNGEVVTHYICGAGSANIDWARKVCQRAGQAQVPPFPGGSALNFLSFSCRIIGSDCLSDASAYRRTLGVAPLGDPSPVDMIESSTWMGGLVDEPCGAAANKVMSEFMAFMQKRSKTRGELIGELVISPQDQIGVSTTVLRGDRQLVGEFLDAAQRIKTEVANCRCSQHVFPISLYSGVASQSQTVVPPEPTGND